MFAELISSVLYVITHAVQRSVLGMGQGERWMNSFVPRPKRGKRKGLISTVCACA